MNLAGEWTVRLDPESVGEKNEWFNSEFETRISLPGSLAEHGLGDQPGVDSPWTGGIVDRSFFSKEDYARHREPESFRVPFWLQPKTIYRGKAWYTRCFDIIGDLAERPLILTFERPHGITNLWVDGELQGQDESLGCPHRFRLDPLKAGTHRVTICVDNEALLFVGEDAHSISDHTQTNWNGIVGSLTLAIAPSVEITGVRIEWDGKSSPTLAGHAAADCHLIAQLWDDQTKIASANVKTTGQFSVPLIFESPFLPWDEFDPKLYDLSLSLASSGEAILTKRLGIRSVATKDKKIFVNGKPRSLRGTLDCCIFPLTGYPPTVREPWDKIMEVCKSYGLNHIRFHSYCPPEAAFVAADEAGIYLQVEASAWVREKDISRLGHGGLVDDWIYRESLSILQEYGHHPSFLLFAHGNEPAIEGREHFLATWVQTMQSFVGSILVTAGSGWPAIPESDFLVIPDPRCHAWLEGLDSRLNSLSPNTTADYEEMVARLDQPVIAHEIGQWCVLPDVSRASDYTGVLRPTLLEIMEDRMNQNGLSSISQELVAASAGLQAIVWKEEIESSLRTEGLAGFQLLGLQDFPGQGTAPVGVLDHFWQPKEPLTGAMFREFCSPLVPLVRLPRRVFQGGESLDFLTDIYSYGSCDWEGEVIWSLVREGETVSEARRIAKIPTGGLTRLEEFVFNLPSLASPACYEIVVTLKGESTNRWKIWVFPPSGFSPEVERFSHVTKWSDDLWERASRGERIWADLRQDRNFTVPDLEIGFTPIFWNTAWTERQAPHTLGLLIAKNHEGLDGFPTEAYQDWQWWGLMREAQAFDLRSVAGIHPIVRVVDDWFTSRPLCAVGEIQVGKGRMLVTTLNLDSPDPASQSLRGRLLRYLMS